MSSFIDLLRQGGWLTLERMRLWAAASLIAALAGVLYILATAQGLSDYQGRPIGTDFSNIYVAGSYALEGRPEAPFDVATQHARAKEIFGPATPLYGWHYPPFFLFLAALLAMLPYLPALALWQGATFAFYLWSIRQIAAARPRAAGRSEEAWLPLLLAAAFPAVFVNLGHGHNGFLTAALMGFALLLLERRPIVSGILFGLLAYKPQFGLLVPLALIAGAHWKVFASAVVTTVLLALAATFVFGPAVWPAFVESIRFIREAVLAADETGWHKIQSVFAWARMWGAPVSAAYAVQIVVTLTLAVATFWLWRSATPLRVKAAALIVAALLSTPYSLDYDLMVLAPALAFWAVDGLWRGFRPFEKTTLAALWVVPLIARSFAEYTSLPLTAPLLFVAFALLLHRAAADNGARRFGFSRARS